MIRRGDFHNVEILFLEHLAVISVEPWLLLGLLPVGDPLGGIGEHVLVDVAQRDDLDRRDLNETEQVGFAVPASADEADAQRFHVGERGSITMGRGQRQTGGCPGVEELTAIHGWGLRGERMVVAACGSAVFIR